MVDIRDINAYALYPDPAYTLRSIEVQGVVALDENNKPTTYENAADLYPADGLDPSRATPAPVAYSVYWSFELRGADWIADYGNHTDARALADILCRRFNVPVLDLATSPNAKAASKGR